MAMGSSSLKPFVFSLMDPLVSLSNRPRRKRNRIALKRVQPQLPHCYSVVFRQFSDTHQLIFSLLNSRPHRGYSYSLNSKTLVATGFFSAKRKIKSGRLRLVFSTAAARLHFAT